MVFAALLGSLGIWIRLRPFQQRSASSFITAAFVVFVCLVKLMEFSSGFHLWFSNFGPTGTVLFVPAIYGIMLPVATRVGAAASTVVVPEAGDPPTPS